MAEPVHTFRRGMFQVIRITSIGRPKSSCWPHGCCQQIDLSASATNELSAFIVTLIQASQENPVSLYQCRPCRGHYTAVGSFSCVSCPCASYLARRRGPWNTLAVQPRQASSNRTCFVSSNHAVRFIMPPKIRHDKTGQHKRVTDADSLLVPNTVNAKA